MKGPVQLPRGQVVDRVLAGNQPASGPYLALLVSHPPPGPQDIEQGIRELGVTVLAAFALFDPDHHAVTVDVRGLERDHLPSPQPGTIGHR